MYLVLYQWLSTIGFYSHRVIFPHHAKQLLSNIDCSNLIYVLYLRQAEIEPKEYEKCTFSVVLS
jgi:hypothetical protein